MPYHNSTKPRPILKRVAAMSSESSTSPCNSDSSVGRAAVHFPPHSALASTYAAHSSDAYDRSPIAVVPNECALPARGCPGRTYRLDGSGDVVMDDDADDDVYTESTPGFNSSHGYCSNSSSSNSSRTTSPAQGALHDHAPPLIPDLSSSDTSEDSDQGATAFAPFLNGTFASTPMSYHSSEPASRFNRPSLSPKSDPAQLAFLPHPHTHAHSHSHTNSTINTAYPYSASGSPLHASHTSSRDPPRRARDPFSDGDPLEADMRMKDAWVGSNRAGSI
ncbi:hypothetical protein EW145_g4256 [Phellinidium pouzarii]|uniref:Uncharacterized protein n=1 Tax=Phellinidium pouzarii TaxID=167371 RepID=A0A4S4L613_9AGAM|nr:hypothetical protein EW145_g4256 [Phellinidium pouzarii]